MISLLSINHLGFQYMVIYHNVCITFSNVVVSDSQTIILGMRLLLLIDGPGIRPGLALTSQLSLWQNNNAAPPSLAHRIDK